VELEAVSRFGLLLGWDLFVCLIKWIFVAISESKQCCDIGELI
jgi:hypothetical protein